VTGALARPQVSVVVPTKDRDSMLRQSLSTIRWQREVAFETLVVDDGSADPGLVPRIVTDLGDPRFRVVRHDRSRGVSAARNRGAALAQAPWVAFCDDDDLWAPEKLASQLAAACRVPAADWVYVGSVNITANNRVVGGEPPPTPEEVAERLEESNVVPGGASGVIARREAFLAVGGFDPALQPLADWDLWLRLLRRSRPVGVAEPLVAYRVHGTNMSLDTQRVELDFATVAARYPRASRVVLQQYLGWWSLRVGRHVDAARYFIRAAAARDPRYPVGRAGQDLLYLGRHAARDLRSKLVPAHRAVPPEVVVRHPDWRERGRRWVDELPTGGRPQPPAADR
jgi:glycosyltransferase involved in cell wall biosynthesis